MQISQSQCPENIWIQNHLFFKKIKPQEQNVYFSAVKNLAFLFNTTKTQLVKSRETNQQTNKDLKKQAEGEGSCFIMMCFDYREVGGCEENRNNSERQKKKPKKEE